MMKKVFAMTLCVMLLLSLTVSAAAEAGNAVFDCWAVDDSSVYCYAVPGEGSNATVTAAGAPVAVTSVTTVEQSNLPVTYICMIDQSTAYSQRQKEQQRQGVNALLGKLRPQDRLVVVGMNADTKFGSVLTQSEQWDTAIDETLVHTSRTTNLYYDLITMVSKLSDSGEYPGLCCAVMFTDGINDLARSENLEQAKAALNTFRFSLHTFVAVDPAPSDYALKNASRMEELAQLTPGGICVVPNRDKVSPTDSVDKIVRQVLSTPVIQMDAAQLDRGAETVALTVSLGGKTGTVSIPTAQLPDLPPVTEPETTVPWPAAPETTEPSQAQWVVATDPSAAPQRQQSSSMLYFLIGGGIAAIVVTALVVMLLSRRRQNEEDSFPTDENLEFMPPEDAQDAVFSDLNIDSIDLGDLDLKSDFAALNDESGEDSEDYDFFKMPKAAPPSAPKAAAPVPKAPAAPIPDSGCTVRLVPEGHPEGTVEFFLETNTGITVGRSSRSKIVLNELDTSLSGVHMEFQWDSRALYMRDCDSTNGTLVNGAPVKPGVWVRLENSMFIDAGSFRYRVYARKK